jgi:hypothetical protein
MILQSNIGFTAADSDTIQESGPENAVFRIGTTMSKQTSACGQSAYLSFLANDTKTIAMPIGYSSDDRLRFVGSVTGTLRVTITHPTLGDQTITFKNGGFTITMRMTAISITEEAGSSASLAWSMMQTDTVSSEEFS